MIERRHVLMFVTKNTQKLHRYDQIGGAAASLKSKADALSG